MPDSHLESLYREAQAALKAGDYEYAVELLKRILAVNENYKDTSHLLARAVRLRQRRWYNDPRLWGAFGAVAVFILGFMIAPRIGDIFTNPAPTNSASPTITSTGKPRATPSETPTRTPRPTSTPTPPPAWVTDFSEPILSVIANYPPALQDDFHDNSGGWHTERHQKNSQLQLVEGELILDDCWAYRSKMAYTDFVLELDTRFLEGTANKGQFLIWFREFFSFWINFDGSLLILKCCTGTGDELSINLPEIAYTSYMTNHILIIAKGDRLAFYINDKPIYYFEDSHYMKRYQIFFMADPFPMFDESIYAKVALDNLKIWDLEKILNLP